MLLDNHAPEAGGDLGGRRHDKTADEVELDQQLHDQQNNEESCYADERRR
jgi:hypothetical protein